MKKHSENDPIRINHILDTARVAVGFVMERQRVDLDEDIMLAFAVVRALSVISEAASHITQEFRLKHPQIPWENIVGMRNWLIHAYFDVDLEIVWNTLTQDLPALINKLERLQLSAENRDGE
jgi:uncharacterized protein with HEPN domain